MVDNIPPEEPEIELSGRQIEQLDAIDNAVYQTILTFLNKTEDEFPWDMHYIGEVADAIEGTLLRISLNAWVSGRLAGQAYAQHPHSTHSMPFKLWNFSRS